MLRSCALRLHYGARGAAVRAGVAALRPQRAAVAAAAPAAAPQLGVCQRAPRPRPGAQVESLAALEDARPVCSVAWTQRGAYLAVGTNKGVVRIYDAATVRGRAPCRTPPSPAPAACATRGPC